MKYRIIVTETANDDLADLPVNLAESIDRKISALSGGLPGSIKRLRGIEYGYRLPFAAYRILFDLEGDTLRFSAFFIVAMPTLHLEKARKGKRASISSNKEVRKLRSAFVEMRQMFDELCDAHALMLARLANAGKKGMTLNESRAKRGLPPL